MDKLLDYLRERRLLQVTHSLIGLNRMERMVVLENGQVLEQGGYEALLVAKGQFARLIGHSFIESG